MRPRRQPHGFTLVELLAVIAIIGILAALILAGVPRVLERARLASTNNDFNQIRTILTAYYTDHDTYPPMYGYLSDHFRGDGRLDPDEIFAKILGNSSDYNFPNGEADAFFLKPWTDMVQIHNNRDLYDSWAVLGYDTDQDGVISRLEFAPIGAPLPGGRGYQFTFTELYLGQNGANNSDLATTSDVNQQQATDDIRPYIYIPVYSRQATIFRQILFDDAAAAGNGSNARPFNLSANAISLINERLSFPPPRYDTFVLISMGPDPVHGTAGILPEFGVNNFVPLADVPLVYQYHILGLAAHFMATRDFEANGAGDGELDFDFIARTRRGQGQNSDNDLPSDPKAQGPLIYLPGT